MEKLLKISDLCERWQIPKRTVYELAQKGKIPGAFKLGKHWRFREDVINRWIDEQTNENSMYAVGIVRG